MAAPAGVLQRSALVGIPLALVVMIFVTPSLLVRPGETQPTDVPSLIVEATGDEWNATVNASVILYVRSALGLPLYDHIEFNVTGLGAEANVTDLAAACGGAGSWNDTDARWTCGNHRVPSVWLKIPAVDGEAVNVTAATELGSTRFWYNATLMFVWRPSAWVLRITPEGDADSLDSTTRFTADMQREVGP